jgi:hypothetical protein
MCYNASAGRMGSRELKVSCVRGWEGGGYIARSKSTVSRHLYPPSRTSAAGSMPNCEAHHFTSYQQFFFCEKLKHIEFYF